VAGACERRGACRGKILKRTLIDAESDMKTHLGGIDDRVIFILKYLLMKKKLGSSRRGTFLIQGKGQRAKGQGSICARGCLGVHFQAMLITFHCQSCFQLRSVNLQC